MSHHFELIDRVRALGIRLTPQREMILLAVHECPGHVTVEEIYEHVQQQNPYVDISTVYRNLDLLRELGLVSQMDQGDGVLRYEMCFGHEPHHHLICSQCQHVVDLPDDVLDPVRRRVRDEYGFEPLTDHMVLCGTCPACREQNTPD